MVHTSKNLKMAPPVQIFLSFMVVALLNISVGNAQLKSFECEKKGAIDSQRAEAILEKVQAQYSQIHTMRGSFRQDSYVAALDEGEQSSGTMVFSKPGLMRWSYKVPRPQEVIIRNGELWMYQPDKGQVMIDDIGNVLLSALPISFLMGIGNVTKDFTLTSACHGSQGVILRLSPRASGGKDAKEGDGLAGFDLLVDVSKNTPSGAKITSLGGNITGIVFENLDLRADPVPSGTFVLEYPKGVDVLDRRLKAGS
jgi:outer membrane lipoprotein carrier protein